MILVEGRWPTDRNLWNHWVQGRR